MQLEILSIQQCSLNIPWDFTIENIQSNYFSNWIQKTMANVASSFSKNTDIINYIVDFQYSYLLLS